MTLPAFYTVITGHHGDDMATGGDPTPIWNRAYDQYADAVTAGETGAQVFITIPAAGTGGDVTAEFRAEVSRLCGMRGLQDPFDGTPTPDDLAAARADDLRDMRLAEQYAAE